VHFELTPVYAGEAPIFEAKVRWGIPSLAAEPCGPETRRLRLNEIASATIASTCVDSKGELCLWPRQCRLAKVIGQVRCSSEQHCESIPMRFPFEILFGHRMMPLRPI